VRFLATSLATLALAPPFGIWDLQRDLSPASRNDYGDVAARPRAELRSGTLLRCAAWCRLGDGWIAFDRPPALAASDVARATTAFSRRWGWTVRLELTPAGRRRWEAFVELVRRRRVPDVLVVAARGEIAAVPFASRVSGLHANVTLTGFSRASARAVERALR
jgi:hypothetical protein